MYNELAVLVHINGRARAAVIGDAAAQIDTPRLVALAVGGKALGLVGIQRTVKTEIRHILGQPLGVCVHIDRHTLQRQTGAVGQARGVKIFLRLGQIDADTHHDAVPIRADLTENTDDFLAVEQQIIGPLNLALNTVALAQGVADSQTCKQRHGGGLH